MAQLQRCAGLKVGKRVWWGARAEGGRIALGVPSVLLPARLMRSWSGFWGVEVNWKIASVKGDAREDSGVEREEGEKEKGARPLPREGIRV